MKYPKVMRILAIAAAISVATPGMVISTHASESQETPQEYVARTGYVLQAGYHFILQEGQFVILDADGQPLIEADSASAPAEPAVPENPAEPETPGDSSEEGGQSGEAGENTGKDGSGESGGEIGKDGKDESGESGSETGNDGKDESGESGSETGKDDFGESDGKDSGDYNQGVTQQPETPEILIPPALGVEPASAKQSQNRRKSEPLYMTSAQFRALRDRIQYNVEVPIEGLPSFITQEMVVGALKAQDETGYPASVTIAQIIQESGYGKYGPGGEEGKGLSYLAFEYCNLFGIKGTGTAGSVAMQTSEMEANGNTYSIYAGFRAYNTYTECIEDRSKLLEEVYSDLTKNVTDANTFAMKVGKRWATDLNYGTHLIRTMKKYDLYRLDDMTLQDFSEMIGEFANPCPGSTITSLFGKRYAPIAGASTYHRGLDLGTGAYNIPTYAAKAGTVIFAGEAGVCGNLITIDHGDGLVTKYMHHAEIYVEEGQTVEKGQQIGLSGTTGNSTGNHLHFQVEEDGRAVNPLKYLQDEGTDKVLAARVEK